MVLLCPTDFSTLCFNHLVTVTIALGPYRWILS